MKRLIAVLLIVLATMTGCAEVDASSPVPKTTDPVATESAVEAVEPELTEAQIEELKKSCVMIYAENEKEIAQGCGVYIDKNKVLTTNHGVNGYDEVWTDSATLSVVEQRKAIDIALLESSLEVEPVKIGDSSTLTKGSKLIIISAPQGNEDTVTHTEVLDIYGSNFSARATLGGGASGGAVFDSGGNLVGILFAGETQKAQDGRQYIRPINLIQKAL